MLLNKLLIFTKVYIPKICKQYQWSSLKLLGWMKIENHDMMEEVNNNGENKDAANT